MCNARYFHNNMKVVSSVTKKDPPPEKNPQKTKLKTKVSNICFLKAWPFTKVQRARNVGIKNYKYRYMLSSEVQTGHTMPITFIPA